MTKTRVSRWLAFSHQCYGLLLRTYPAGFRRDYGPHMAQAFRDHSRAAMEQSGPRGLTRLWLHMVPDWVRSASEQHVQETFQMSGKRWTIGLGAVAALCGGILGIFLVTQGTNSYGNYGWDGWMAPVTAFLFVLGLVGAMAALWEQLDATGRFGIICCITGLTLMGIGFAFETMWFFIFTGPLIVAPIGGLLLGISVYRRAIPPPWWRWFAVAVVAIAIVGFGVEMLEGIAGNSTPDRGLQLAEALLSCLWIGLGVGLWLQFRDTPNDPQLAA